MQVADESAYEEVIQRLRAYTSKVFESMQQMRTAGVNCVDTTDQDPAAVRSNDNLQKALNEMNESLNKIYELISKLQAELERIREAAAKANSDY